MRINFVVEDFGVFKYLGCATAAKNLYEELSKKIDVSWNDKSTDFDIAHFHTFGPQSLIYAKKFKGKKIITSHSTPSLNRGNVILSTPLSLLYKPLYNLFDHIISVSDKCKRELAVEMKIKKEITTIYNGIDVKKFSPNRAKRKKFRKRYGIDKNEFVVLTVAQRTPRKGIYDFLRLAKKLPQFKFLWVGEFPYKFFSKDYFKIKKAIENKSRNSIFPGFVNDITEVYSAADVFFMPSYAEGHSVVMLEALSMKLPIVARNLEEFREAFRESIIYFNEISEVNENTFDRSLLKKYKRRTRVVSNFDIRKIAQQHINLYKRIIEK